MKNLTAFALLSLLLGGHSLCQARQQGRVLTKGQQAAQAAEAARARALGAAKTAALVIRATTTVACPGGAPGDCIRTDTDIISQVQSLVDGTEVWGYFEKVDATEADILLEFQIRNNSSVTFNVRDTDSNKILYSEYREVVSLDNDINRMIAHFLLGAPKRTEAERETFKKKRRCAAITARLTFAEADYQQTRKTYDWKVKNRTTATQQVCEKRWLSNICAEAANGGGNFYSEAWPASVAELNRDLASESDELQELEQRMRAFQSAAEADACTLPSPR